MLIKELELLTNNISETQEFYGHLLQFQVTRRSDSTISFAVGHSILTFYLTKESKPFYHLAFLIPENKLEEALHYIEAKTKIIPFSASSQIATFENWNAKAFYFHDIHANILECIARYDLNFRDESKFSSSSIIGINEIGIAVPTVEKEVDWLVNDFGLTYYDKGPKFKDFTALGNANGLMLLVNVGRGWLPTGKPAERHFIKVNLEQDGNYKSFTFN